MKKNTLLFIFLLAFGMTSVAQIDTYPFSESSGTYTPITGGTVLGNTTSDDQRFLDPAVPLGTTASFTGVGFPIGFNFTYNGFVYDRFAVNTNGWISLGTSAQTPSVNMNTTSAYTPLSSVATTVTNDLVARIAGFARDLQMQAGGEMRFETIGAPGSQTLVVQWTNARKWSSSNPAIADSFNFQIRLNEGTNSIDIVYGTMTNNVTAGTVMVGLRANPNTPASNYNSRTTTTNWDATTASIAAGNTLAISSTVFPASGKTFSWTLPSTETLDYYNLQFPATGTITYQDEFTVYAQAYLAGVTDTSNDPAPGVLAWIGYNTSNVAPTAPGWTWVPATFNVASGPNNNDEYQAEIGSARAPGTYYYASRFRLNTGPFTYGGIQPDASFGGTWGDNGNISGVLTVLPPPAPANDDCDNAVALTVNADYNCGVFTSGTTVSATDSGIEPTFTVSGTPDNDVWFSFVATSANHRVSLTNVVAVIGASVDMGIAVFDGTGTCSSLALVGSSDPNTYNVTGLIPGTTYYVAVYGWVAGATTAQATFDICVGSPPPPPANDDFANAAPIVCGDNILGNTSLATLDEDNAPDGFGADMDAPNVWYVFDSSVFGPADVTINMCPSAYDTSFLVYTGTSGNLTLVGGNDDGSTANCPSNGTRSFGSFVVDGVQSYYIAVEGWNVGSVGAFDLTLTCVAAAPAPANDECVNAEALTFTVTTSGTTVGATQNGTEEQPSCDLFGSIADVWYSVVLASPGDLSVSTIITGTSTQANVAIYSACGGLTADQVGCADESGGEDLTVTGLAAGTYYIRVWSDGVAARIEGTFDIVADFTLSNPDINNQDAFTYYPNPVKNTLQLNAQSNIQNVSIYNMLGQEVLRTAPNNVNSTVDMSAFQTGAYFVKVTINDRTETIRVIKQ